MRVSARADIVVGVPTLNEAGTVGAVAEACSAGLQRYFADCEGMLIGADSDSRDGTREAFLSARTSHRKLSINTGRPGKGRNVRRIMEIAAEAGAERVAIVDGDLRSLTPEWMHRLLSPLARYEYVTPYYRRHKYDGICTNHVCYPLLHALTGREIRQPIGGEFAFTRSYLADVLSRSWPASASRFGIDVFMTTTALARGFRVCQARLGAKTHAVRSPEHDAEMLRQVIDSCFDTIDRNRAALIDASSASDAPILGDPADERPVAHDPSDASALARLGYEACSGALRRHLSGETADAVAAAFASPAIRLDQGTWTSALLELMAAHSSSRRDPSAAMAAAALNLARMVTFRREVRELAEEDAEELVRAQAVEMAGKRDLLLERWREETGSTRVV